MSSNSGEKMIYSTLLIFIFKSVQPPKLKSTQLSHNKKAYKKRDLYACFLTTYKLAAITPKEGTTKGTFDALFYDYYENPIKKAVDYLT
ncbi:hypothetical protein CW304_01985 [Bacillus sp. UFRGS-B20]|nr:hypothetical protein CW304_01985 [Bacillus sp. UFRGS-B20]